MNLAFVFGVVHLQSLELAIGEDTTSVGIGDVRLQTPQVMHDFINRLAIIRRLLLKIDRAQYGVGHRKPRIAGVPIKTDCLGRILWHPEP